MGWQTEKHSQTCFFHPECNIYLFLSLFISEVNSRGLTHSSELDDRRCKGARGALEGTRRQTNATSENGFGISDARWMFAANDFSSSSLPPLFIPPSQQSPYTLHCVAFNLPFLLPSTAAASLCSFPQRLGVRWF